MLCVLLGRRTSGRILRSSKLGCKKESMYVHFRKVFSWLCQCKVRGWGASINSAVWTFFGLYSCTLLHPPLVVAVLLAPFGSSCMTIWPLMGHTGLISLGYLIYAVKISDRVHRHLFFIRCGPCHHTRF